MEYFSSLMHALSKYIGITSSILQWIKNIVSGELLDHRASIHRTSPVQHTFINYTKPNSLFSSNMLYFKPYASTQKSMLHQKKTFRSSPITCVFANSLLRWFVPYTVTPSRFNDRYYCLVIACRTSKHTYHITQTYSRSQAHTYKLIHRNTHLQRSFTARVTHTKATKTVVVKLDSSI